jgi:hypothetical protein
MIDSAVSTVTGDRDSTSAAAQALEDRLNQLHAARVADMKRVTPLDQAKSFSSSLEGTKAKLGDMSKVADEALEASGATFEKQHLLDALDKVGHGQGKAIGDEQTAALGSWQNLRNRIAEQYGDTLNATELRQALKQIRQDTNYNQGTGEFNGTLDKMRKNFTGMVSGALKKSAPKYAEQMEAMAPIADNLGTMNQYFGDDAKALSSLEALRNKTPRSQLIEDALGQNARANGDDSLVNSLSGMRKNQSLLERLRNGEDLRSELHPEDWKALQEAKANAEMAANVSSDVERLGPNRTYGVAKSGLRDNNTSHLDKKALDALSHTDGQDYRQMIEDKGVHDQFYTERPNGARMAVIGGAVGGAIGHAAGSPVTGAAIGANVGGAVDKYGPRMVKGAADAYGRVSSNPLIQEYLQMLQSAGRNGLPPNMTPEVVQYLMERRGLKQRGQ